MDIILSLDPLKNSTNFFKSLFLKRLIICHHSSLNSSFHLSFRKAPTKHPIIDPSTDFQSCSVSQAAVGFNFPDAGINFILLPSNEVTIPVSTSNKEDHFHRLESSYWVSSHVYLLGSIS